MGLPLQTVALLQAARQLVKGLPADAVLMRSDAGTKIIPGHGALANKSDLQRTRDMLVAVRANVKALVDQGKTEDEVVAAKPTAAYDAQWGNGFMKAEQFTRFTYQSLKR